MEQQELFTQLLEDDVDTKAVEEEIDRRDKAGLLKDAE